MPWTVFYVPFSVEECYGTKGRLNVKVEVDGHQFRGVLLPSRNGHYMVFNREMRERCGKKLGDTVQVALERDTEPRVVELPDDIAAELRKSGVLERFVQQPNYLKREQIKKITSAKRQETRARRIRKLVEELR